MLTIDSDFPVLSIPKHITVLVDHCQNDTIKLTKGRLFNKYQSFFYGDDLYKGISKENILNIIQNGGFPEALEVDLQVDFYTTTEVLLPLILQCISKSTRKVRLQLNSMNIDSIGEFS